MTHSIKYNFAANYESLDLIGSITSDAEQMRNEVDQLFNALTSGAYTGHARKRSTRCARSSPTRWTRSSTICTPLGRVPSTRTSRFRTSTTVRLPTSAADRSGDLTVARAHWIR